MGGQTCLRPFLWCLIRADLFVITCQLLFLGSPILLVAVFQGLCMKYDWFGWLERPLDLGLSFRGKRVFGDHKTWRGAAISILFCMFGSMIQMGLQRAEVIPPWLPLLDYTVLGPLAGLLLGIGMTFGELPNSFLKRQLGIEPGAKGKKVRGLIFFIFDQVDLTIGIWIFLFLLIRPPLLLVAYSLILTFILHVSISTVGYCLGMRKTIV